MLKQTAVQSDGLQSVSSQREIVITRIFNAPRDLVFKAWTEPHHIEQWWGPKGFTTRVEAMDLRPGGTWRYVMCGPDGTEYPAKGVFREVIPPERIVTSDEFDEGFEQVIDADLPSGLIVATASFEDLGNQTRLTLRIMHTTTEDRRKHEEMGVITGWNSSFECLDEFLSRMIANQREGLTLTLPSDREIVVTRVFNAPRQLVFKAWTQPEHVKRWFGCGRMTVSVCEIDLRVGGTWRYVLHDPSNGTDCGLSGEYREIVQPERLVATERYEWISNSDHLNTLTLTEQDGKTTLHIHIQYSSVEQRDGDLQAGMEGGMRETFNRLADLLQSMT